MSCYIYDPRHVSNRISESAVGGCIFGVLAVTQQSVVDSVGWEENRKLNREREGMCVGGAGGRMTHSFGFVPGLDLTQVVVRPGRKFKRKFKPKQPVGELHEIKQP